VFDSKSSKRPKTKTSPSLQSVQPKTAAIPDWVPSPHEIRERAYQLYESRGGQHGQAQQDWLMAEQQIRNQHR
jgi:hypothetical protein